MKGFRKQNQSANPPFGEAMNTVQVMPNIFTGDLNGVYLWITGL